jgi:hypothetical protein
VFEAEDTRLGRVVAVKLLKPEPARDPDQRESFFAEARVMAGLYHPGMVPVYDSGTTIEDEPFYAMEQVRGSTLAELLRSRTPSQIGDRHVILRYVDIFERVCQTVAHAHARGMIHRDLKPGNVMLDEHGAVYVMDWGLAKRIATEEDPFVVSRTEAGVVKGTPAYLSPERVGSSVASDTLQGDVFALGVLLYEILTGRRPFQGATREAVLDEVKNHKPAPPARSNRRVGRELSALCMKALEKDPRRRYASAGELADDVRRYREFLPVSAIKPRMIDHATHWTRRNRVTAAVTATLLLVGCALAVVAGIRSYTERQLLNDAFVWVQESEAGLRALQDRILEARRGLDAAEDTATRQALSRELEKLEARAAIEQLRLRGRLGAVIGFTFPSPDPRALGLARSQTLNLVETLLENEDHVTARAFLEATVEQIEAGNLLEFSEDEIIWLRAHLLDLE